ncbi:hypothetical protein [Pradoshia sp. D12]|uniref:hypothetical protein n=1 Tax=Pradoshia sp. D12 TaxID=2651284 RepID=UPI00178C7873|nr:hypothetical protein [Pradoshia sp. D12]
MARETGDWINLNFGRINPLFGWIMGISGSIPLSIGWIPLILLIYSLIWLN